MSGRNAHRQLTTLTSIVMMLLGAAMIVRTLTSGGGPLSTGILLGVLFVLAGAGRLTITRRTRS